MERIEFQWLQDGPEVKDALKELLECSGQLLKKHFSSKELHREVRARDVISMPIDFVNHLAVNPVFEGPTPVILKETKDYLVLHKPANLHCHPLCYSDRDTLLNFLASKGMLETLFVNRGNYDRGLLYRLDYETSGVIVLAKSDAILEGFRVNFARMKAKYYWAIVEGDFDREGRWGHFFKASGPKGHKQSVTDVTKPESSMGSLKVKKVQEHNGKSLLLVKLETGLRHQIRAQLSHLGFPIVGDELYGGQKADRLFLHALRYEWESQAEDANAELFERFFDVNSALQMTHDMFGTF